MKKIPKKITMKYEDYLDMRRLDRKQGEIKAYNKVLEVWDECDGFINSDTVRQKFDDWMTDLFEKMMKPRQQISFPTED